MGWAPQSSPGLYHCTPGSPHHLPSTPDAWESSRCPTPTFRLVNASPRTGKKQMSSLSSMNPASRMALGPHGDLIPRMLPHGARISIKLDFQASPPRNLGSQTISSVSGAQRKGNPKGLLSLPVTIPSMKGFECTGQNTGIKIGEFLIQLLWKAGSGQSPSEKMEASNSWVCVFTESRTH